MATNKRIHSLEGLRGIMIFLIVLSHMEFLKYCNFGHAYELYWHNPTIAVDYFFMLSGFGMMYSFLKHSGVSAAGADVHLISIDFAKAKIRKLYLLYVVTMLAMVPMLLAQGWLHGKSLLVNLGTVAVKLAICAPLVQSAFGTTHLSHAFNGVCWFFSTLALIYLVSPWLMKRIAGWQHVWRAVAVLPVVIAVLYVVFGIADAQVSFFDDFAYGSPYMRVWFVVYGMVLARIIFAWRMNDTVPEWMSSAEIGVALSCIAWFFLRNTFVEMEIGRGLLRFVDVLLCGGLLFILSFERGRVSRLLERPGFLRLGHLAMYVYLIHYPLRCYWEPIVLKRVMGNQMSDALGLISVAIIVGLTMVLVVAWDKWQTARRMRT